MRSYLSNRTQSMRIGSVVSQCLPISKGVPQGSVLGPLLFNLMVNDLLPLNPNLFSYADDTLLFEISDSPQAALQAAREGFAKLSDWYLDNGLSLCPQKNCLHYS